MANIYSSHAMAVKKIEEDHKQKMANIELDFINKKNEEELRYQKELEYLKEKKKKNSEKNKIA
jgi:hypothetical protein